MASVFYLISGSAGVSASAVVPLSIMTTSRSNIGSGTASLTLVANSNNIQYTNAAGGTLLTWVTPPIEKTFTLSGSVTMSMWGAESNTTQNVGPSFRIWHKSASLQGTGSETNMMTQISGSATEWQGTTITTRFATSAITNTVFNKDDRIVLRVYAWTGSGAGFGAMGNGSTTIYYGGITSGSNGDSILQFSQDIPMKKKVVIHDR